MMRIAVEQVDPILTVDMSRFESFFTPALFFSTFFLDPYSMLPLTRPTMQVKMLNGQTCLIAAIDMDLDLLRYFIIYMRIAAIPLPHKPPPLQPYMRLLSPIATTTHKSHHPLLLRPRHSQL
jgi:hypothetical protein